MAAAAKLLRALDSTPRADPHNARPNLDIARLSRCHAGIELLGNKAGDPQDVLHRRGLVCVLQNQAGVAAIGVLVSAVRRAAHGVSYFFLHYLVVGLFVLLANDCTLRS